MTTQKTPNSAQWLPDLTLALQNFHNVLKADDKDNVGYVTLEYSDYNTAAENILKKYTNLWNDIKENPKKGGDENKLCDRHKIAALYIKAILIVNPFKFKTGIHFGAKKGPSIRTVLATEYFAYYYMQIIIISWNKQIRNDANYKLIIPDNIIKENEKIHRYEDYFVKRLYHYRDDPTQVQSLLIAHIIFFIESISNIVKYKEAGKYFKISY
jgi:hypothetical protein